MASIRSESTEITAATDTGTGAEYSEDGYSMVSLNTRDHDEFYDHRQHSDIVPQTVKLGYTTSNSEPGKTEMEMGTGNGTEVLLESDADLVEADTKAKQMKVKSYTRDSPINYSVQAPSDSTYNQRHHHHHNHNHNHDRRPSHASIKLHHSTSAVDSARPPVQQRVDPFADNSDRLNKVVSKASVSLPHKPVDTTNNDPTTVAAARKKSFDSDVSHTSVESQETEEDVCFPMQPPLHTRINGIDFDELEEFAEQQRTHNNNVAYGQSSSVSIMTSSFSSSSSSSSAALKYTPRFLQDPSRQIKPLATVHTHEVASSSSQQQYQYQHQHHPASRILLEDEDIEMQSLNKGADEVVFNSNNNRVESNSNNPHQSTINGQTFTVPDRFYFFNSQTEDTVHAPDIPSLVNEGQTFYNLFNGGEPTWWLDCSCPTDDEMRCIAKAFGIHPLTAEDIRMQETREKVELFKTYYFVAFHTFDNDKESENFLEPINVYIVIFRYGILTFHFNPISHCANVRRRVRQLRDYVDVNSDWLCYALIDDITDGFAPVIQSIEYEADSIEDSVFVDRDLDFAKMVSRIGESRRKTMTLMRLLSGKADVIKMFSKRCQDEANGIGPALTSQINIANLQQQTANSNRYYAMHNLYAQFNQKSTVNGGGGSGHDTPSSPSVEPRPTPPVSASNITRPAHNFVNQPRGEIAMYLGDIQDHLLTMYQNLAAYEKIFSRSHSNYLAQLQVESYYTNTKVTEMLGKVTILGTMLVPLNVVPGLFGMNVHIPGENVDNLAWFFGIVGFLVVFAIASWFAASYWVRSYKSPQPNQGQSGKCDSTSGVGSKSLFSSAFPHARVRGRGRDRPRGVGEVYRSDRSATSLPSKYSRWN